jgi:hypothetical protein
MKGIPILAWLVRGRGRCALFSVVAAVALLAGAQNALAAAHGAQGARVACTNTPITFGAAPTTASISAAAEVDCYSFTGAVGDQIRIRVVETSGTLVAQQAVLAPNNSFICTATTAQETTCKVLVAGTHQIQISDNGGTKTGNYSIAVQRLNNPLGCAALTFGAAPTAAAIAAVAEADCYTFTGAVGDQINVRMAKTSGTISPNQEMVRPDGTTLACTATTAVDKLCALPSAGTYKVLVDDYNGTNTGNYVVAIQRLNNPAGCAAIGFGGTPTAASIGTAGEIDCYSFSGTAGNRIRVRVIETSPSSPPLSASQAVVRPNGTAVCTPTATQDVTCALDTTGTQRILVGDSLGTSTGNYSILVERLNNPSTCTALPFGAAPAAGGIGVVGEMDCFSFSGTAGDRIRVRVARTSGSLLATQETVRPSGAKLSCGNTTNLDTTCAIPTTGTYRVFVYDNGGLATGNYSIAVQRLNNPTGCTALSFGGGSTAAAIGAAGELDCYSFTGAIGDRIRLRTVETSSSPPFLATQEVLRPDGTAVCPATSTQDTSCDIDAAGIHRIVVADNNGPNTGGYAIAIERLNNPPTCPALTFGAAPVAGTIAAAGEIDCFRFSGTAGDRIRVRLPETSGALSAIVEVVRPDGTTQSCATSSNDTTCTLEDTGAHRIFVYDQTGLKTGDYVVSAQRLNNPAGCTALTFGAAPTTAAIAAAGQTDCFSFAGTAGDRIRVRVAETAGSLWAVQEMVRPNGTTLACGPSLNADATCVLNVTGQYRILVDDNSGTATGSFAIAVQSLGNPTGCTALSFGAAPTAATIGSVAELDCYTFTGAAGDRIRVRVVETSGNPPFFATQEVVRTSGTSVCAATTTQDVSCDLDSSGVHRIFIADSNGSNTGAYAIAIQRLNNPVNCPTVTFGTAPTAAPLGTAGAIGCVKLAATVGDVIRTRVAETSGTLSATQELVGPDGVTMPCSPSGVTDMTCTADDTGTFVLLVYDTGGVGTGNAAIAVQRLNNPVGCTALVFGAAQTAGAISTAGELDCYTFTATAGDTMTVNALRTSGTLFTPLEEVVRPNGTTQCGATNVSSSSCTTDTSGTYTIIVADTSGPNTGGYTVNVTT